ncbi:MAG TPA: DUF2804 domain-containing protein [Deltaproteobacteria bacterium]|nr:DUF2804 domain-containing protein [Deltaproteobacteria bacterium]HPR54164.1 DUF2804 domain-containing protein [Deltaproteobacteria bacterium]HXK45925.1 DUF2804 domain-containing protein [Deltaproteobacteria bacterium]
MEKLVGKNGLISWGIYNEPVGEVNYLDYDLRTAMGKKVSLLRKRAMANQFHFFGVMGPEVIIGMAVVDLKYLANGFLYIYDRQTKEVVEAGDLSLPTAEVSIATCPDNALSRYASRKLTIEMTGKTVKAAAKGMEVSLGLGLAGARPLRICTRAGYTGWVYTQKTSPVTVSGSVTLKGRTFDISSPSSMALIDWTCGYMRRKTCWNWAATASTLPDGRSLGMNLSCGVNETSFTENAFWLDGIMTKVDTVNFIFDKGDLINPWRVVSYDGKVDLTFMPERSRGEKINAGFIASRFTQLVGTFAGTLRTDGGETLQVTGCPGFAEDHYAKW